MALGGIDPFTDDDEEHHAATRKVLEPVYTHTSMLKNEGAIDVVVNSFMEKLGEFSDRSAALDFGQWLEM